ncbi:MAG TPA: T9SS type A sorting domain-containing protein [Chitinophagaceae bacterium]|nr:T9SS type A sorting domain-containing protein [Chitinophagaceae bacterium]HNF71123.1 T9SS type A sorting domain-containing protein [Chitinophagaceae bacterium]
MRTKHFCLLLFFLSGCFAMRAQLPFTDGFETGSFVSGNWNVSGSAQISSVAPASGLYCVKGEATWGMNKTFPGMLMNDSLVLTFKIKASQTNTTSAIFRIKDTTTSGTCAGLFFDASGTIKTTNGTSTVVLMNYDTAVWYSIRMVLNMLTQKYDLWIDQNLVANDFAFYTSSFTHPYIFSWSSVASTGIAWLDDIQIEGDIIPLHCQTIWKEEPMLLQNPVHQVLRLIHCQINDQLVICSSAGQTVFSGKINHPEMQIDLSAWPPGAYILQINSLQKRPAACIRFINQ